MWPSKNLLLLHLYESLSYDPVDICNYVIHCLYYSENRYRQKSGLKFLPSFKIQHNKYSKIVKWTVPRKEKYPALPGFPSQPVQNCPGPVCQAYLVHTTPTLHFFIRYSYTIHFFQNGVTTVLDVDCHSMLYLFYGITLTCFYFIICPATLHKEKATLIWSFNAMMLLLVVFFC